MQANLRNFSILASAIITLVITMPSGSRAEGNLTRIEIDEAGQTIKFMINGKEVMIIDQDGAHVQGNLEYTGTVKDTPATPELKQSAVERRDEPK